MLILQRLFNAMESQQPHIVIKDTLEGVGEGNLANYLAHSFCYEGSCSFTYNHKVYTLKSGDCMIIRRCDLLSNLHRPMDWFRVVLLITLPILVIRRVFEIVQAIKSKTKDQ